MKKKLHIVRGSKWTTKEMNETRTKEKAYFHFKLSKCRAKHRIIQGYRAPNRKGTVVAWGHRT